MPGARGKGRGSGPCFCFAGVPFHLICEVFSLNKVDIWGQKRSWIEKLPVPLMMLISTPGRYPAVLSPNSCLSVPFNQMKVKHI